MRAARLESYSVGAVGENLTVMPGLLRWKAGISTSCHSGRSSTRQLSMVSVPAWLGAAARPPAQAQGERPAGGLQWTGGMRKTTSLCFGLHLGSPWFCGIAAPARTKRRDSSSGQHVMQPGCVPGGECRKCLIQKKFKSFRRARRITYPYRTRSMARPDFPRRREGVVQHRAAPVDKISRASLTFINKS
jgi:hypothetical protein